MTTHSFTYSRTHTATFVADKMRNILRDIIRESGLDPADMMGDWQDDVGNAVKGWLETEDLLKIVLEFYESGSNKAAARWDFPIEYDGSGVDDDMWVQKQHILKSIAKAKAPPAGCKYRVVLITREGRPDMPGMGSTNLRSTEGLVCRISGTAVATNDIMAGMSYWRTAS